MRLNGEHMQTFAKGQIFKSKLSFVFVLISPIQFWEKHLRLEHTTENFTEQ